MFSAKDFKIRLMPTFKTPHSMRTAQRNGTSSSNVVNETAKSVLGPKQRIHQDWFDDNDEQITQLLREKNSAFITWQNDHSSQAKKDQYKHLKKQAQRKLREMKDAWWDRKAVEVQMYADTRPEGSLWTFKTRIHSITISRWIYAD